MADSIVIPSSLATTAAAAAAAEAAAAAAAAAAATAEAAAATAAAASDSQQQQGTITSDGNIKLYKYRREKQQQQRDNNIGKEKETAEEIKYIYFTTYNRWNNSQGQIHDLKQGEAPGGSEPAPKDFLAYLGQFRGFF